MISAEKRDNYWGNRSEKKGGEEDEQAYRLKHRKEKIPNEPTLLSAYLAEKGRGFGARINWIIEVGIVPEEHRRVSKGDY